MFWWSNGSARVVVAGGTPGYTYIWYAGPGLTNPIGQTTDQATGLVAGTYWVKITDSNGCWISSSITLTQPPILAATAAVTSNYNGSQLSCNGASDGRITVTAGGGTGTLTYLLTQIPGNISGFSSGIFTGIPAGTYTVRVTDINGCNITTAPVTITNPAALTAAGSVTSNYNGSQVSCNGSSDGVITVIAGGGTGVITFVLDQNPGNVTGAASGIFTGLNAATYTVTVTDINACTKTTSNIVVSNPPAI